MTTKDNKGSVFRAWFGGTLHQQGRSSYHSIQILVAGRLTSPLAPRPSFETYRRRTLWKDKQLKYPLSEYRNMTVMISSESFTTVLFRRLSVIAGKSKHWIKHPSASYVSEIARVATSSDLLSGSMPPEFSKIKGIFSRERGACSRLKVPRPRFARRLVHCQLTLFYHYPTPDFRSRQPPSCR